MRCLEGETTREVINPAGCYVTDESLESSVQHTVCDFDVVQIRDGFHHERAGFQVRGHPVCTETQLAVRRAGGEEALEHIFIQKL